MENKFQEGHFICQGMGKARPAYRVLSIKADQNADLIELIIYLKRTTDKQAFFIQHYLYLVGGGKGCVNTDPGI